MDSLTQVAELARGFATPTLEDWRALVARAAGAVGRSAPRRTLDGVEVEPLYAPAARSEAPLPSRTEGAEAPWDIRAPICGPGLEEAHAHIVQALNGGAHSILARLASAGAGGIAIASAGEMTALLEGVALESGAAALDAGFLGASAARWLAAAAKAAPRAALAFHMDPLSAFAAAGSSPGPIGAHVAQCAALAPELTAAYPRASLFLASGQVVHEAGGSEAQEIAFCAAAGLAYVKALVGAGLEAQDAVDRIVLGLAVGADVFGGAIKLRAARRVWARIATACGAAGAGWKGPRIEARSSARMLTRAEAWNNLLRLTAAAVSAALGGAQAIVLGAFTDPLGAPGERARRLSRNIQIILMDEASLGAVRDPAAGSGYVEALTAELARAAWARFRSIEAAGGAAEALCAGLIAEGAAASRQALAQRLASRQTRVLGVTDFAGADPAALETEPATPDARKLPDMSLPGPDGACPALNPITLEALAQ